MNALEGVIGEVGPTNFIAKVVLAIMVSVLLFFALGCYISPLGLLD